MMHGPLQVFLEILPAKPRATDGSARKSLIDERLELHQAEHGHRGLPAVPHPAFSLRTELRIARAQESGGLLARQIALQRDDRDCLAHGSTDEWVHALVIDDVVEWHGVAVENGGHDAWACLE